jgi:MFS family permease
MRKIISDYIADIKLITRNVRLFIIGALLIGLLQAFMYLLLNLYLKDIGYGEGYIGRVLSMLAIGSTVAAIPSAYVIARYKLKPLLIATALLLAAFFLILCNSRLNLLILTSSFMVGVLTALLRVASGPFVMRNSTERERTLLFSLLFANFMIAGIIGSIGGGAMQDLIYNITGDLSKAYRYTLSFSAFVAALAVIPFYLIKARPPDPDEARRAFSVAAFKRKWRLFFKLTFPQFLVGAGAGLIIPFLNLYFRNRFNLNAADIGIYFSILQVTMLAGVLAGPVLRRRFGFIRTVVLTELASIPFMLILSYTENLTLAFWAFILRGSLMNMAQPVSTTFAMEAVNEEDQGLINSLSAVAWTASWAVSTQLGGSIIENHGFVPSFLLAIVFYLASAAFYYSFFAKSERHEEGKIRVVLPRMD